MGFENGCGLPTAGDLAELLANEVNFPGSDNRNFFQVTQYYAMARDPHLLRKSIQAKLSTPRVEPSTVHKTLAELPFRYVLTTNFDNLMEQSFQHHSNKSPMTAFYDRRMDAENIGIGTIDAPIVYKLHGTLETPHSMVVTEDDVIDFASRVMLRKPPLPTTIRALFSDYSIIFIGYGFKDWNIRVIMRALRGEGEQRSNMFLITLESKLHLV